MGPITSTIAQQQEHQQFAVVTLPSLVPTSAMTPSTQFTSTTITMNVSTPSSLTGFLAPGGQLPVHKDGGPQVAGGGNIGGTVVATGKPSIVKVTLSPLSHQHQQHQHQRPVDDQVHTPGVNSAKFPLKSNVVTNHNNHQANQQLPTTRSSADAFQSTPFKTSSANDWYYANYNRTNVEPFVSKTSAAVSGVRRHTATATLVAVAALSLITTSKLWCGSQFSSSITT